MKLPPMCFNHISSPYCRRLKENMRGLASCIVLLIRFAPAQAEPTSVPTLGPSASPVPTTRPQLRRLKGKSGKAGDGPIPDPTESLHDSTDDGLHRLPTSGELETSSQVEKVEVSEPPSIAPWFSSAPTFLADTELAATIVSSSPTDFKALGASDYPSLIPSITPTSIQTLISSSVLQVIDQPTFAPSLGASSVPSQIPSSEPSIVPSSSLIATELEYCNLEAMVDCRLEDGSSCSSLSAVPPDAGSCTGRPYELEWFYTAGSCHESSTDSSFECKDDNGGPSSIFMAYMTITGLSSYEVYFSSLIFQGIDGFPVQSVELKNDSNPDQTLDEMIHVIISKGSPSGEILQEMMVPIACGEEHKLSVGDSFGALQLANYRSKEASSIPAFALITWIYTAKNTGNTASGLKSMTMGSGHLTTVSPDITMPPGDEYHIVAHESISLIESATFSGELMILEGSGMGECWSTSNYTVSI